MDYRPHIVVVEDEATQRHLLVEYLARQKLKVTGVDGGSALRKLVERELPTIVLLDVGLPMGMGSFWRAGCANGRSRIGIIMVTAASETVDWVVGLETGADDYIAKPFDPRELLARVKSLLRRAIGAASSPALRVRIGRRVLDLEKRVLIDPTDSSEEALAASELDLLEVSPGIPTGRCSATGCWKRSRIASPTLSIAPSTCGSIACAARSSRSGPPCGHSHGTRCRLHVRATDRLGGQLQAGFARLLGQPGRDSGPIQPALLPATGQVIRSRMKASRQ